MRSNVITIRLITDDYGKDTNLSGKSWLLQGFAQVPDLVILGFADPGLTKDASLGKLFYDLKPNDSNIFNLELGAILPDWLPNLNGQRDYYLELPLDDKLHATICFSNQMVKLRYKKEDEFIHAITPNYRVKELLSKSDLGVPEDCYIETLKTMVSMQFEIIGATAEDAIEENIDACIDRFIETINRVIGAHLMLTTGRLSVLNPVIDRGVFDYMYLVIKGHDENKLAIHRIAINLYKSVLRPRDYPEEEAASFISLINGSRTVDDITRILNSGKSYIEAGLLEFALLQLVIASEIATTRFIHQMLLSSGVSKGKLEEYERDLTYSVMLNILLFSLCPPGQKPDRQLIGIIDKARRLRNDVMHEGQFSMDQDELRKIYDATSQYIEFINKILASKNLQ